jgi:type I restriction enzyme S subunit
MFEDSQLVIGRVGAYCGAVYVTKPKAWVTDNALFVREYFTDADIDFLAELFRIMDLNQYAGRAAQPLLSGSRIHPLEIYVPPIMQQKQFAKIKQEFANLINGLESSSDYLERLFGSLSQQSFSETS